jgi:hypothetical protein
MKRPNSLARSHRLVSMSSKVEDMMKKQASGYDGETRSV